MSAALKLLPRQSPLFDEDGDRFIGHVVRLKDFPVEYRAAASEMWDALIDGDHDNVCLLPDGLTDPYLSQWMDRSGRFDQKGLYALELGPAALHDLVKLERPLAELYHLRRKAEPTDAERARIAELAARETALRSELKAMREARRDLKDDLGKKTGALAALQWKKEPTAEDLARMEELAAEADAIRARLIHKDSVIFRHSGPGFEGRRHIEIVRRLKKKKKPESKPKAAAKKAEPVYNRVPETTLTPEELAAAAAQIALAEGTAPTAEDLEGGKRAAEDLRKLTGAHLGREKPRPAAAGRSEPAVPISPERLAIQRKLEAKQKGQDPDGDPPHNHSP
jgi:hypothetical protein